MTPGAGQRESKNFARVFEPDLDCKLEESDEKMYIEVEVSGCNMNTKALKVPYHNIMLTVILYFVEIISNSTIYVFISTENGSFTAVMPFCASLSFFNNCCISFLIIDLKYDTYMIKILQWTY